jgi:hypothetical protein
MKGKSAEKLTKGQRSENIATVEGGMSMGVYTGLMPKIEKTHTMRGAGAATKGKTFSKNG